MDFIRKMKMKYKENMCGSWFALQFSPPSLTVKRAFFIISLVPDRNCCVLTMTFPRWLQLFLATSLLLIDFGLVAIVAILEKQRNLQNPQGKLQNLKT